MEAWSTGEARQRGDPAHAMPCYECHAKAAGPIDRVSRQDRTGPARRQASAQLETKFAPITNSDSHYAIVGTCSVHKLKRGISLLIASDDSDSLRTARRKLAIHAIRGQRKRGNGAQVGWNAPHVGLGS